VRRNLRKWLYATLATVALVVGVVVGVTPTAPHSHHVTGGLVFLGKVHLANGDPTEFCDNVTQQECLNAWNGGPFVKSYTANVTNDAFGLYLDTGVCNHGYTTTNCPLAGVPAGHQIVQFQDQAAATGCYGDWVGDYANSPSDARASACDASNAWGGVFIVSGPQTQCGPSYYAYINVHWSSNWVDQTGLSFANGGNANGQQAYLDVTTAGCYTEYAY
jgi:hypothetical protein